MKKKLLFIVTIVSFISLSAFTYRVVSTKTAEVEQRQGVYVFYKGQKPVGNYEYLGTVESGAMIKNYKLSYLVPLMIERTKKKYPNAEGIIFVEEDLWKCDAIKFKE
jgi:hypothetical protein